MPITPSLRHCSNKYKLAREGEKDKEKDEDFEKVKEAHKHHVARALVQKLINSSLMAKYNIYGFSNSFGKTASVFEHGFRAFSMKISKNYD